jgi:hypothetical protein
VPVPQTQPNNLA